MWVGKSFHNSLLDCCVLCNCFGQHILATAWCCSQCDVSLSTYHSSSSSSVVAVRCGVALVPQIPCEKQSYNPRTTTPNQRSLTLYISFFTLTLSLQLFVGVTLLLHHVQYRLSSVHLLQLECIKKIRRPVICNAALIWAGGLFQEHNTTSLATPLLYWMQLDLTLLWIDEPGPGVDGYELAEDEEGNYCANECKVVKD